jgi:hypothetical protein
LKNPFRLLVKRSRRARNGISAALSIQRLFLPLVAPSKKSGKLQKPPVSYTRGLSKKSARPQRPKPGSFVDGVFTGMEGKLAYKLYTPEVSKCRKLPLVVMLHGCTQSAADFAAGTGHEQARRRAWISRALSATIRCRKLRTLLELAPSQRSTARSGRARVGGGPSLQPANLLIPAEAAHENEMPPAVTG